MKQTKNFSELHLKDISLVGGKNASLGEMFSELSSKVIKVMDSLAVRSCATADAVQSGFFIVRTGLAYGWKMLCVRHGSAGLIIGDLIPMGARDAGGIIQQGGTMLGSARCPDSMIHIDNLYRGI